MKKAGQSWLPNSTEFMFRNPRQTHQFPSPQRGRGVRGEGGEQIYEARPCSQSGEGFGEFIQLRGIPLTPSPSPALGRGEPTSIALRFRTKRAACHHNLQRSLDAYSARHSVSVVEARGAKRGACGDGPWVGRVRRVGRRGHDG